MYQPSAADFADTGQWRLLLNINRTGLEAFLENTLHADLPPQLLCKAHWDLNKDRLRENIEEAVYNNPRLLDDFATRIVIYDTRTLFVPTEIADEALGNEEELYKKVFDADDADIMSDRDRDITALWSPAPGIKAFLMRTFPGSRITCNLLNKVRELRKTNSGISLFAFARENEADIILLDGDNLLSASSHEWSHTDDIAFLTLNLLDIYGIKPSDAGISLIGASDDTEAWDHIRAKALNFNHTPRKDENYQW